MVKKICFLIFITLVLSSSYISCEENDKKDINIEIKGISIDKQWQSPNNINTLYFQRDKLEEIGLFTLDIEMYINPVDIILVLDSSMSMNSRDIKDSDGDKVIYRMDIQKRIARQVIESLFDSSNIGIIVFGHAKTDKIVEKNLTTERKELIKIIDNLEPFSENTRGGKALDAAIEMAHDDDRQCILLLISDGLEVGEGYSISDFTRKAQNYKIKIYCVKIGTAKTGGNLEDLASKTKGKYYSVEKERDIYPLTSDITNITNDHSLNNVILEFIVPEEIQIENLKYYQGQRALQKNLALQWESIPANETIEFTTTFGAIGEQVQDKKFLEIGYELSYQNPLTEEKNNLVFNPQKINVKIETKWNYYKRIFFETLDTHKILISLVLIIFTIVIVLHYRWKYDKKRLQKEKSNHLLQAKKLTEKREFEGALAHLEKADKISIRLNKKSDPDISKKISYLENTIDNLEKIKKRVQTLIVDIIQLIETIQHYAPIEFLRHSLTDFEVIQEEMGANLRAEKLGEKATSIFKTNDIDEIKHLEVDLRKLKKILSNNEEKIGKAYEIYIQTKPTLETLLQKNNLDIDRITEAIEDTEVPHLVLNYVINDHPELQSTWNELITDKLKDEREAFQMAENYMSQNEFKKAENLLLKAKRKAEKIDEKNLLKNIEKLLEDCRKHLEDITETVSKTYLEGMDLFKTHEYAEAQSKFQKVKTLGEQIHDESWIEKGKSMIIKCDQYIIWDEQTRAIIDKLKESNGIAPIPWLGRYVETDNIDELLRYIRNEYNKQRGDDTQYRIYPYEQPPVFIDFYALANYIIENPGEIGGKIPPNHLSIPVPLQKELLELLKPSHRG